MSPPRSGAAVAAIEAHRIAVRYGERTVLEGVDLRAARGRVCAVSGHSGSGKTSLMMVLSGLQRPDAGTVELGEGVRLGYVPQSLGLSPGLTSAENVSLPLQAAPALRRPSRDEIARRTLAALDVVGLAPAVDRLASELSGGQRQRVAIARVIAGEADVIVADEPTSELDAENRERILQLFMAAASRGTAVVIATHDPDVADCCDDWWELVDGRLVEVTG